MKHIAALALVMICATVMLAEPLVTWTTLAPTTAVQLRDPRSISLTSDDVLYVADTGHHRVLALDSLGKVVYETGGMGTAHGQFQWPRKVIADRGASVWVLDYGNRRIEKFSRTLEYQGTFTIPSNDSDVPDQIEEFTISPQGDLFVFDRDNGRLVRYDPLFRLQNELGQRNGEDFVSAITRIAFSPRIGVTWWERGSHQLRFADPLFSSVRALNLNESDDHVALASSDSCVLIGTRTAVQSWCDPEVAPAMVVNLKDVAGLNVKRLDDIAQASDRSVYVLDGLDGAIYRLFLKR